MTLASKRDVAKIDRYVDVIINSPFHDQYHTRPFLHRLIIGIPCQLDPATLNVAADPRTGQEIVILHSLSYPEGKRTPGIRADIFALQRKGRRIRFVEMSG